MFLLAPIARPPPPGQPAGLPAVHWPWGKGYLLVERHAWAAIVKPLLSLAPVRASVWVGVGVGVGRAGHGLLRLAGADHQW